MGSNIGETGVKSIRLKGQRIEELPLGTGNQAAEQLALAEATERLNAIAEVNAKYPSQRIDFVVSRIEECEMNKGRMRKMIAETHGRIQEYQGLVMQCEVRDKMLAELPCAICKQVELEHRGDERHVYEAPKDERKAILTQWGRWDVAALKQQMKQDEEAIERFEAVIAQEDESIKEHTEIVTLCKQRDKELAALGAQAEGS